MALPAGGDAQLPPGVRLLPQQPEALGPTWITKGYQGGDWATELRKVRF